MIGIFRQKNPSNGAVLFVYGLALKFFIFLDPRLPAPGLNDGAGYRAILNMTANSQEAGYVFFAMLSFLLIFLQALYFNRVFNDQKMLLRPGYLPGMSYLLVTSLFPEWNFFSAPLLANTLLVWIWSRLMGLATSNKPKTVVFNIGMALGFMCFIYWPSAAFMIMILFGLLLSRPFKLSEWLVALMGAATPLYFWAFYLYMTDKMTLSAFIPEFRLQFKVKADRWSAISAALLVLPFVAGAYQVQGSLGRMLIVVRRNWSLLLIFLVVGLLVPALNTGKNFENWIFCALPFAAFHAGAWFYSTKKWAVLFLHWGLVAYIVYRCYMV